MAKIRSKPMELRDLTIFQRRLKQPEWPDAYLATERALRWISKVSQSPRAKWVDAFGMNEAEMEIALTIGLMVLRRQKPQRRKKARR